MKDQFQFVFINKFENLFDNYTTLKSIIFQIIQIFTILHLFQSSAFAHHAEIDPEHFSKYSGLSDSEILYPYRGVKPRNSFPKNVITGIRFLRCNKEKHTLSNKQYVHEKRRTVRIDLAHNVNVKTKAAVNGLGKMGLHFAWRYCPAETVLVGTAYSDIEVQVWRNNRMIFRYEKAAQFSPRRKLDISNVWSLEAEQRAQQQASERKARMAAAQRERAEKSAAQWRKFWFWTLMAVGAFLLLKFHGPLLTFYYRTFTRHPMQRSFDMTVASGRSLDPDALIHDLESSIRNTNRFEAIVRAEQADKIMQRARQLAERYRAGADLADSLIEAERAKHSEKRSRNLLEKIRKGEAE